MSELITFVERQTFWMEPDHDETRPRWMTSYPKEGREEDGEFLKLDMDARRYPPGARVTIEVPCCPKCGDPADMNDKNKPVRKWPRCDCGFSWNKWSEQGQPERIEPSKRFNRCGTHPLDPSP